MQSLEIEYQNISKNQWLSQTDQFKSGTPSNYIIYKCLPGLGATHGELKLYNHRNSIIVEPNVPVIEGKRDALDDLGEELYPNMLAVYKDVNRGSVKAYLANDIYPKKIVCTPEAYIKKVKPEIEENSRFNLYDDFFMLLDECDKLISEIDYRDKIIAPMDDFFKFRGKAMVSATPLQPSDLRFASNGFKILQIVPDFDYSRNLNLISTNNITTTLKAVFKKDNVDPTFIFLNSTDLIYALIKILGIDSEAKVFCADKSVKKLVKQGFDNASSVLGGYAKYNFLTSRFFSAVDIKLAYKPNVLMITNVYKAPHSIIDPYTESIQICGRFRNGVDKVAHFTNYNRTQTYFQPEQALQYIQDSYAEYEKTANRLKTVKTEGGTDTFESGD